MDKKISSLNESLSTLSQALSELVRINYQCLLYLVSHNKVDEAVKDISASNKDNSLLFLDYFLLWHNAELLP